MRDLMTDPAYEAPEFMMARMMATIMGSTTPDKIFAIEIAGLPDGYRLGAGVQLVSGDAKGRQLYTMATAGDVFMCDGQGDANILRFDSVRVGDEVHVEQPEVPRVLLLPPPPRDGGPAVRRAQAQRGADLSAAPGSATCRR